MLLQVSAQFSSDRSNLYATGELSKANENGDQSRQPPVGPSNLDE